MMKDVILSLLIMIFHLNIKYYLSTFEEGLQLCIAVRAFFITVSIRTIKTGDIDFLYLPTPDESCKILDEVFVKNNDKQEILFPGSEIIQ